MAKCRSITGTLYRKGRGEGEHTNNCRLTVVFRAGDEFLVRKDSGRQVKSLSPKAHPTQIFGCINELFEGRSYTRLKLFNLNATAWNQWKQKNRCRRHCCQWPSKRQPWIWQFWCLVVCCREKNRRFRARRKLQQKPSDSSFSVKHVQKSTRSHFKVQHQR